MPHDEELLRYGYWSQESEELNLPSYRATFIFLSRIPLDLIHAYLRMRLETRPEKPSIMSIRQVICFLIIATHKFMFSKTIKYMCNSNTPKYEKINVSLYIFINLILINKIELNNFNFKLI